jgi:uncharacterized membrane-anchored protein
MNVTRTLLLAGLALILGGANWAIVSRERQLATGATVYLELAPVDPRSLMQGDYMALRYKLELNVPDATSDGYVIVRLDERRVASPIGWNGEPGAGDVRLRYRVRNGRLSVGSDAFFFEEGTGPRYQTARYGEFRVTPDGDSLLVGLRDPDLRPLTPR